MAVSDITLRGGARVQAAGSELDPLFEATVTAAYGRPNLALCFQCGACTASCPTMDRMQYGPRKIMHMVHLGMADEVLRSPDIWLCVSCYSCSSRCPQNVRTTDVIAELRSLSIARGLAKDKEAAFSQIFVDVLKRYGRMYEPEVLLRFDATGISPGELVKQAGLGIRMFRKGKLGLRPERIDGIDELSAIVDWAKEGQGP